MKKLAILFAIVVSLISQGLIYSDTMICTNCDYEANVVTIQACNGNVFEFSGIEDYTEGDLISVIMWSNNTPEVNDDIILYTRYSGIAEWFVEIYPNH